MSEDLLTADVLTADSVPGYVAGRAALRGLVDPETVVASEVGDGNLNLVFRCADAAGRRLVLKQALPYVRLVGPEWPMTVARAAREANAIRAHSALSDDVLRLIDFDEARHVLALQDLSDHEVFRTRLNEAGPHADVVERLTEYVADVAFGTSFLALGEEEFRRRAAAAINPELCAITENLILTEPYLGAARNSVRPALEPQLAALQADADWVAAAMEMKHRYLSCQEVLLHGDLHTGSVFVRGSGAGLSVKAFDPEFAWYGPVGFDLGLLWANMLFAGVRAAALGQPDRARSLLRTVECGWTRFAARMWQRWPGRLAPARYPDAFLARWLPEIKRDAFGFAGCEAARRTIGLAKVSDLESLDDREYGIAGAVMLRFSRLLLVDRTTVSFDDLVDLGLSAIDD
ncbi:MAG TPA: S-methyl-5-thioribose kinase [Pseudonocardia sp.]|uniref:S-methyl-5-thioribose kinase n=1 Tax=Pseudonocardia sp. TaxID=60912 RepID=UPI002C9F75EA|nr:S-methyl-5-thioribose kinase [Pseudonocardia sp.]HTF52410.1 S-methyl-5-thioribose kinase [Pseudonocardia sp.]